MLDSQRTVATNVVICHAHGTFLLRVVWLRNVIPGVQIGQRDGQITFFDVNGLDGLLVFLNISAFRH